MDTLSSPTPRSRGNVAYSRPSMAEKKFLAWKYAVRCVGVWRHREGFRALQGFEARTSSELGRRTAAEVPWLEYDGGGWLEWGAWTLAGAQVGALRPV